MQSRGFTFWFRRNISRLALILGICSVLELFMHLTEGTKPNIRIPLEYWPAFVVGLGLVSFVVAWLTYVPPADPPSDRSTPPG